MKIHVFHLPWMRACFKVVANATEFRNDYQPFSFLYYILFILRFFLFEEGSQEISFLHFVSIIHALIKAYMYFEGYQC